MSSGRATWLGHATVLIELAGTRLLTDPLLRDRFAHIRRRVPAPEPAALDGITAVLLSHLHHDHLDLPSLRRLGKTTPIVIPRGAGSWLGKQGFSDVTELSPGERLSIDGVDVVATHADHDNRRLPLVAPVADPVGYDLRGTGRRVYFAGDTDIFDAMADLRTGDGIDLALIPVWGWGPRLGPGHLNPARAAEAGALIAPRIAVPIHWGTFLPIGLKRRFGHVLHEPPRDFEAQLAELAPEVDVRVLDPGGSVSFPS